MDLVAQGRPAAPGLARGIVVQLASQTAVRRNAGDRAREAEDLRAALQSAIAEVTALMARADPESADILAFQVAMMEDDALAEPAFEVIASGAPADAAWLAAMASEIAGYEASDDDYFRARSADLADIRDRVLRVLTGGTEDTISPGAIVAGHDMTPSRFLGIDWSRGGGIALADGSPTAHVAMLARARGVPMVVGLGAIPSGAHEALVDGETGEIVWNPTGPSLARFEERACLRDRATRAANASASEPAFTADGEPVKVMLNVADPDELAALDPVLCDGIGLVRTEFLFHRGAGLPDENTQYAIYRRLAEWAAGRPVTIRTLDAGGDKPIPGLTINDEANPFLGQRGLRLSLARPDVFRLQLRALARAAVHGNIRVMLPMVTVPAEVEEAARLLDAACAELAAEGVAHTRPVLGMMVEVPAAALTAARYPVDFYSIGSNDLTQYTMAAARDDGHVAHLAEAGDPAVIELIRMTVAAAAALGRDVSLCGDAGGDPALVPKLLGAGLRSLSMAPIAVGRAKLAIRAWSRDVGDGG